MKITCPEDLKKLDKEINEYVKSEAMANMSRTMHTITYREIRRIITDSEWKGIKKVVEKYNLICDPHNAEMGFGFGIAIYDGPPAIGLEPEFLIEISNSHFGTESRFNEGWRILSPLSHNKKNEEKLKLYGFDPLKDKDYYDY
jgi:hypothetical protein